MHSTHSTLCRTLPLTLLAMFSLIGCWQEATYCTRDIDCFQGEICESNACVSAGGRDSSADITTDLSGDMGADQTSPGCPAAFPNQCSGTCVNTQNDATNCGTCGKVCDDGDVCSGGRCVKSEGNCTQTGCEGFTWCDADSGQCKPGCERTDQCPETQRCNVNRHRCECSDSKHLCDDGRCYLNSDVMACGESCQVCPGAAEGNATCELGQCALTKCEDGQELCGGQCSKCPTDGVRDVRCDADQCVAQTCQDGFTICPDGISCCKQDADCDPNIIPQARGRTRGNANWSQNLTIPKFRDVLLDASRSSGSDYRFRWKLETPPNSIATQLRPNESANSPSFFVSSSGEYSATLTLFNDRDIPSCTTSVVAIKVVD